MREGLVFREELFDQNGGLVREISLFQGNLGWRNIIICPKLVFQNSADSISWDENISP